MPPPNIVDNLVFKCEKCSRYEYINNDQRELAQDNLQIS